MTVAETIVRAVQTLDLHYPRVDDEKRQELAAMRELLDGGPV
jgi:hypothetical protein